MSDQIVEQSTRGWGARLLESIKGVLFGLALFVGAFPLLWWNEGRALTTARSLEEGAGAVIDVAAEPVDPSHADALVHVTGRATTDEVLTDPVFGVSETAIRLERTVAMFQWKERKEVETRKKLGGGDKTVTTYHYDKTWSGSPIESSRFKEAEGHENPQDLPFRHLSERTSRVTLGAFQLSAGLVDAMDHGEALPLLEVPAAHAKRATAHDGALYFGADPLHPAVGDTRVSFRIVRPAEVSVVAAQQGDALGPYTTRAGRSIELLAYGAVPAAQMFEAEMSKNATLTWILRGVGFLMMAMGFGLILRPLVVVADVVPLVGDLLGMGVGLASSVVAGALSLGTIAIAWIAVRPLVGVPLLVAGLALAIVPKVLIRRRAAAAPGG